jgi:hypothetical protein
MLGFTPVVSFGMMYRLRMNPDSSALWEILGAFAFCTDPVAEEMEVKAGVLHRAKSVKAANPELALVFQVILMMSVLATTGIVLWRWFAGNASDVDWAQLSVNLVALAILLVLWRLSPGLMRQPQI